MSLRARMTRGITFSVTIKTPTASSEETLQWVSSTEWKGSECQLLSPMYHS